MDNGSVHVAVLLHEIIGYLADQPEHSPDIIYLDGTLGGAGHARAIADAYQGKLTIIGLDRDPVAVKRAAITLAGRSGKVILEHEDYRNLDAVLDRHGISAVDRILLDLGISSDELEVSGRGFSFQRDEPLMMTMNDPAAHAFTARDIVNGWEESTLADIIFAYGEEKYARRIARAIVTYRLKTPIETSGELAEVVKSAVPAFYRRGKIHPATRTFQALRIAVNDELGALREGLQKGFSRLKAGGRMAVISFHSLEDRIVKDFFKVQAKAGARILTKKPVTAGPEERAENPRARSAKLRVIQK